MADAIITKTGWQQDIQDYITLSFTNATRTFTLTPASTVYYYIRGTKYTLSAAKTVVIDDTEGVWYIYLSGTTLTASQTGWTIREGDACPVAIVYWDATNNVEIGIDWECHGYELPPTVHDYLHNTVNARYESGFGLTEGSGGNDGQIALVGGVVWDEDIEIAITDGAGSDLFEQELGAADPFAAAQIPVYYRSGASAWRKYAAADTPFYDNSGGDNVHYNAESGGSWSSQEASGANKFVAYWIFATNEINEPIISIMGQREDTTLAAAKANNTLSSLSLGTLPFVEFKILYRLILRTDSTLSNGHVEDYRTVSTLPSGGYVTTDHGTLAGLSDDDHTQYLLVDGTRAMTGALNMGSQNITSVGTVDGIDISAIALDNMPAAATGNIDCSAQAITNVGNVDGVDISAIAITSMPTAGNNWKVHYTNGSGVMTELALGAAGEVLTSGGAASAPTFEAPTAGAIDDLTDVTITSVADNEVLAYNSGTGEWINQTAAEASLATASHTHDTRYPTFSYGAYTGDGSTSKSIDVYGVSGVSRQIRFVWIWKYAAADTDDAILYTKCYQDGDFANLVTDGNNDYWRDNRINQMSTTTFYVDDDGSDYHPNKNGTTYRWMAAQW